MRILALKEYVTGFVLVTLIALTILHSFLLFHVVAEFFSILISFSIFIFGWNTRKLFNNNFILTISIGHLFIAILDFIHTFTYKGLDIFHLEANTATQFWIAARSVESLNFVLAYYLSSRKIRAENLLAGFTIVTVVLVISIVSGYFPDCFVEGSGLTVFKKVSEYIISLIIFVSIFLIQKLEELSVRVKKFITLSLSAMLISELTFTVYQDVYDIFNVTGHLFKIVSFYFMYKAILEVGLRNPMELLRLQLQNSETENKRKHRVLVEQSRLLATGEVLKNIAHQWRQPLSTLSNIVQDIDDASEHGELDAQYLKNSVNKSEKLMREMSQQIDQFRTLYAPSEQMEDFDVKNVIEDVLKLVNRSLENTGISVSFTEKKSCIINGYYNDFVRAVFNIVENSVDACKGRENQAGNISISIEECAEHRVRIIISDNAGGIDPEVKETIFEPYTTTKHKSQQVGLGLYISKIIIEEYMKGSLSVENGPSGAIFIIEV